MQVTKMGGLLPALAFVLLSGSQALAGYNWPHLPTDSEMKALEKELADKCFTESMGKEGIDTRFGTSFVPWHIDPKHWDSHQWTKNSPNPGVASAILKGYAMVCKGGARDDGPRLEPPPVLPPSISSRKSDGTDGNQGASGAAKDTEDPREKKRLVTCAKEIFYDDEKKKFVVSEGGSKDCWHCEPCESDFARGWFAKMKDEKPNKGVNISVLPGFAGSTAQDPIAVCPKAPDAPLEMLVPANERFRGRVSFKGAKGGQKVTYTLTGIGEISLNNGGTWSRSATSTGGADVLYRVPANPYEPGVTPKKQIVDKLAIEVFDGGNLARSFDVAIRVGLYLTLDGLRVHSAPEYCDSFTAEGAEGAKGVHVIAAPVISAFDDKVSGKVLDLDAWNRSSKSCGVGNPDIEKDLRMVVLDRWQNSAHALEKDYVKPYFQYADIKKSYATKRYFVSVPNSLADKKSTCYSNTNSGIVHPAIAQMKDGLIAMRLQAYSVFDEKDSGISGFTPRPSLKDNQFEGLWTDRLFTLHLSAHQPSDYELFVCAMSNPDESIQATLQAVLSGIPPVPQLVDADALLSDVTDAGQCFASAFAATTKVVAVLDALCKGSRDGLAAGLKAGIQSGAIIYLEKVIPTRFLPDFLTSELGYTVERANTIAGTAFAAYDFAKKSHGIASVALRDGKLCVTGGGSRGTAVPAPSPQPTVAAPARPAPPPEPPAPSPDTGWAPLGSDDTGRRQLQQPPQLPPSISPQGGWSTIN